MPEEASPNPDSSADDAGRDSTSTSHTDNSTTASTTASSSASAEDKQAAYYRRQAEKAQRELETIKKSQMSEAERVKAERDEYKAKAEAAEQRAQSMLLQSRFESAAAQAGAHDPEAAFALVDRSMLAVDDNGRVVGVEKALKVLREAKPYLFREVPKTVGSGGGNPGAGPAPTATQSMNDWIRRVAGM